MNLILPLKRVRYIMKFNNFDSHDFIETLSSEYKLHTPDTLGTLPDIAANARPLRMWLKCSLNVAQ